MSGFVSGVFVGTTADDERSYFSGEIQPRALPFMGQGALLEPGEYRVVDGTLCRIVSGLSTEEVRARLVRAAQPDR